MGMPLNRQGGRVRAPLGGRAKIENSSRRHPRKFGQKRFSGGEEVLAGKWGGLFLGYLLGKNFRRRDRDQLSFRSEAREASGNETPCLNRAPSFQCRDVYQDCTP